MIKFFRKIRYDLMEKNKTGKYFKYAIGEIVLVVIGILIALSINNWNENRNEIIRLNRVLDIVKADFVKDTLFLRNKIKFYKEKNTQLTNVLKNRITPPLGSITELNYKKHFPLTKLVTTFSFFQKQNRGIELLKNTPNKMIYEKDSLITNLIAIHSNYKLNFDDDNESINKLSFQNTENFEKYSWYTDWLMWKYNTDMFQYFYADEFKRKAGSFRQLSGLFLDDLKSYDRFAKTYIALIEKRLNE